MFNPTSGASPSPSAAPAVSAAPAPAPSPAPSQPAATEVTGSPAPASTDHPEISKPNERGNNGGKGLASFLMKEMSLATAEPTVSAEPAPGPAPATTTAQAPQAPAQPTGQQWPGDLQEYVKDGKLLGKFTNMADALKSYQESEKWNTQLAQRHGLPEGLENQRGVLDLTRQQAQTIQELQAKLASSATQPAPQTQGASATNPTDPTNPAGAAAQEFSLSPEEMNDLLYTDPAKYIQMLNENAQKVASQAAKNTIEQWQAEQTRQQQEHQKRVDNWTDQLYQTTTKYPDARDLMPEIDAYLKQNPHFENLPNAVELAYKVVKADRLEAQVANTPQPRSEEDLLNDEAFRQKALSDPNFRQAFNQVLANDLRANRPPTVLSKQSGHSPITPKPQAKSIREAGAGARAMFQRELGGPR